MSKVKELQHVSLATTYETDNTFDSDKFIKMRLRVCHDGVNPNKSSFEVSDMEKAQDSIKNIPVLANVIFDEEGNPQFGGHDMALEKSKVNEEEYKLIYKETPIGIVPESCNHTIEKFNDKNYVFVDAYIWKGYSNYAQDIIERDKDIKLSMEIAVDAYNYNAKKKCYNITDYRYTGITFLNKDFGTGMENALATTGTFEKQEDNEDSKEKLIMMMEELKETLSNYNINKTKKGGNEEVNEKLELLKKFNLTIEQLDFNIEDISIEDLKVKLNEKFNTNKEEDNKEEGNKEPEKFVKSFELSHSDIKYALYKLLSKNESEDNEWYFIDQVYDDRFEYINWDGTKIFRQSYKKDGDNVSFEGDRIELFQERLTTEEKESLDKMRSNYSNLETEVNTLREFKVNTEKEEREESEKVLFEEFEDIKDVPEFLELKNKASEYDLETLAEKCFAIRGRKNSTFNFSKKLTNIKIKINHDKEDTSEDEDGYGGLMNKYIKK